MALRSLRAFDELVAMDPLLRQLWVLTTDTPVTWGAMTFTNYRTALFSLRVTRPAETERRRRRDSAPDCSKHNGRCPLAVACLVRRLDGDSLL